MADVVAGNAPEVKPATRPGSERDQFAPNAAPLHRGAAAERKALENVGVIGNKPFANAGETTGLAEALPRRPAAPNPKRQSDCKACHPMSSSATLAQIQEVMEDVFDRDDLMIRPETNADDIEEWDSLSHIRLIVALERRLKVRFKNAELDGLMNVGDLVNLIDTKRG